VFSVFLVSTYTVYPSARDGICTASHPEAVQDGL
jgi:hypothetical protein